jgi:hypothetical protein
VVVKINVYALVAHPQYNMVLYTLLVLPQNYHVGGELLVDPLARERHLDHLARELHVHHLNLVRVWMKKNSW